MVSEKRYGGTPGRIFYREGEGVVTVAGADARTGRNHGLAPGHRRRPHAPRAPADRREAS